MSILSDQSIDLLCQPNQNNPPMITPYVPHQVRTLPEPPVDGVKQGGLQVVPSKKHRKIISYGLSSYGYDVRLADTYKIFTNVQSGIIDPLDTNSDYFVDHQGEFCIIPPNSYILGHTVETFHIPQDIMVVAVGKSTLARLGLIINVTPIEAGFTGHVVIEIANATPLPVKVYANMGIAQFMFFKGDKPCVVSYADRGGKYNGQKGITLARL